MLFWVDIAYFAAALGCGTDASVVIFTVILSPTFGTYAPTPKAERSNRGGSGNLNNTYK